MLGERCAKRVVAAVAAVVMTIASLVMLPGAAQAKYYSTESCGFTLDIVSASASTATLSYNANPGFYCLLADAEYVINENELPAETSYTLVNGQRQVRITSVVPAINGSSGSATFLGWSEDESTSSGSYYQPGDTIVLEKDTVLYAQWTMSTLSGALGGGTLGGEGGDSDGGASSNRRALYVERVTADTIQYNIYELYSGPDSDANKLLKTVDSADLFSELVSLSEGYTDVDIYAVNAIRCAYGTRSDVSGSRGTWEWGGDSITPPDGCIWTFGRWNGYGGPIFWPSSDETKSGAGDSAALRLVGNITIDGSTSVTEDVYPLVYTDQTSVYCVQLDGVTLRNNNRSHNDSDDINFGSAISLTKSSPSDRFGEVWTIALKGELLPHSYLAISDCLIENCSGSEGAIFVDESALPVNEYVAGTGYIGGGKNLDVKSIDVSDLTVSNSGPYSVCVTYYPRQLRLYQDYPAYIFGLSSLEDGMHAHASSAAAEATLVEFYTDGTNVFKNAEGEELSSADVTSSETSYTAYLSAADGYKLVESLLITAGDDLYSIATGSNVGDEQTAADGLISFTRTGDAQGTLTIAPEILVNTTYQVSIEAFQYYTVECYHRSGIEITPTSKSVDSSGTFTVSYTLAAADGEELSSTFYVYTVAEDGVSPLYEVQGTINHDDCKYYSPTYTAHNCKYDVIVLYGSDSDAWCTMSRYDNSRPLVITVQGSARDIFRYSNKIYVSPTDPAQTVVDEPSAAIYEDDELDSQEGGSANGPSDEQDGGSTDVGEDEGDGVEPGSEADDAVSEEGGDEEDGTDSAESKQSNAIGLASTLSADSDASIFGVTSLDEVLDELGQVKVELPNSSSSMTASLSLGDDDSAVATERDSTEESDSTTDDSSDTDVLDGDTSGSDVLLDGGAVDTVEPGEAEQAGESGDLLGNEGDEVTNADESVAVDDSDGSDSLAESAVASGVSAQVFLARSTDAAGSVGARWIRASVSDDGLVYGDLLLDFNEGAEPAAVYAWAVDASAAQVGQDADAWAGASDQRTLYSQDPGYQVPGDVAFSFTYYEGARSGILHLAGVSADGLLGDGQTLNVAVCVVCRPITDLGPQTIANQLRSGALVGLRVTASPEFASNGYVDNNLADASLQTYLDARAQAFAAQVVVEDEAPVEETTVVDASADQPVDNGGEVAEQLNTTTDTADATVVEEGTETTADLTETDVSGETPSEPVVAGNGTEMPAIVEGTVEEPTVIEGSEATVEEPAVSEEPGSGDGVAEDGLSEAA